MNIREWVNRNSAVAMIAVIVILILALAYLIRSGMTGRPRPATPKWFYCLETQQLYGEPVSAIPPVQSPWGHEAVEAIVYFCDDCKGEPYIAHLTKFTPEIKTVMEQYSQGQIEATAMPGTMEVMAGTLVSDPDDIEWYSVISPKGGAIKNRPGKCGEDQVQKSDCEPPQVDPSERVGP